MQLRLSKLFQNYSEFQKSCWPLVHLAISHLLILKWALQLLLSKLFQSYWEFQKACWPLTIYWFPIHPLQLSLSAIQSTCLIQKGKFDYVHTTKFQMKSFIHTNPDLKRLSNYFNTQNIILCHMLVTWIHVSRVKDEWFQKKRQIIVCIILNIMLLWCHIFNHDIISDLICGILRNISSDVTCLWLGGLGARVVKRGEASSNKLQTNKLTHVNTRLTWGPYKEGKNRSKKDWIS